MSCETIRDEWYNLLFKSWGKRQFFNEIPGLLQLCGVVVLVPLRSDALFANGFRIALIVTRVDDGLVGGRVLRGGTCGLP